MLLLYKYQKTNKKGRVTGFIKQVYAVDFESSVKIGGLGEPGKKLHFWPEGGSAYTVITDKDIETLLKIGEIEFCYGTIYKITNP